MSQQEPDEAELRAALEEQMKRISVHDVLIQTVVTLINLGGRRLGLAGPPEEAGETDVDQAFLAIEGARALAPLLPEEQLGPVRDALSQLQMAYVQITQGQGAEGREQGAGGEGAAAPEDSDPAPAPSTAAPDPSSDEAERAKARSKIWTPPGT
ncbi:MAG: hypothetical protein QOC95_2485 [Thermoleophilaceae bacterium]|nr:hypothetical protein [Thermoleophilaceae bacterium]